MLMYLKLLLLFAFAIVAVPKSIVQIINKYAVFIFDIIICVCKDND